MGQAICLCSRYLNRDKGICANENQTARRSGHRKNQKCRVHFPHTDTTAREVLSQAACNLKRLKTTVCDETKCHLSEGIERQIIICLLIKQIIDKPYNRQQPQRPLVPHVLFRVMITLRIGDSCFKRTRVTVASRTDYSIRLAPSTSTSGGNIIRVQLLLDYALTRFHPPLTPWVSSDPFRNVNSRSLSLQKAVSHV